MWSSSFKVCNSIILNKSVNLHEEMALKKYINLQRKRSEERDRLILTNTALRLGQHDLIKKKKYTDLTPASTASLSKWQSGRWILLVPQLTPSLKVRPILQSVPDRGYSSHPLQITFSPQGLPRSRLSSIQRLPGSRVASGSSKEDFSIFLQYLEFSAPLPRTEPPL